MSVSVFMSALLLGVLCAKQNIYFKTFERMLIDVLISHMCMCLKAISIEQLY